MRRARYFLAVLVIGAAASAPAQARAVLMARLLTPKDSAPKVAVHVSNLLDDPEFQDQWRDAFVIQVHWKVQLWQKKSFVISYSDPQPAVEWDVLVQQVPQMDLFNYTERIRGKDRVTSFRTLDSLKAFLTFDVSPLGQRRLPAGDYFYRIDVRITASEHDPLDPRTGSDASAAQKLIGLFTSSSVTRDLPTKELPFTIR